MLGVFAEERLPQLKDVETLKESKIYDFYYGNLRGICAPHGLSKEALKYYEETFYKLFTDKDVIAEHQKAGISLEYLNHSEYDACAKAQIFFADDFEKRNLWKTDFNK